MRLAAGAIPQGVFRLGLSGLDIGRLGVRGLGVRGSLMLRRLRGRRVGLGPARFDGLGMGRLGPVGFARCLVGRCLGFRRRRGFVPGRAGRRNRRFLPEGRILGLVRRWPGLGRLDADLALAEARAFGDDLGHQFLGLPAGRPIADRHDAHAVLADHILERHLGLGPAILGGMRVDHGMVDHLAARVEDGDLAAVLEPGIDGQHGLPGDGRLEQQAAQVAGEDLDGVLLGGLGQVASDLTLHAGQHQPIERVDGRRHGTGRAGDGPPAGAG